MSVEEWQMVLGDHTSVFCHHASPIYIISGSDMTAIPKIWHDVTWLKSRTTLTWKF